MNCTNVSDRIVAPAEEALWIKWPPNNETSTNLVCCCTIQQATVGYHSNRIESEREGFCVKNALRLSHA